MNPRTRNILLLLILFVLLSGVSMLIYKSQHQKKLDDSSAAPNVSKPIQPVVLVGAGDISSCDNNNDAATAALLDSIDGTVFTAGDNVYDNGKMSEFLDCYGPTWGKYKSRTRPTPGNHDYGTGGASDYFAYFGSAAGTAGKGYYSYDLGSWHIVSLNSNCLAAGGCDTNSEQGKWLESDLKAASSTCTLAVMHHPRFSSGSKHGNNEEVQPLWQILYNNKADVVIAGHEHLYERFDPQDPMGTFDEKSGIVEFVVGTGGKDLYSFGVTKPNSAVRDNKTFGVLKLTLGKNSYSWDFIPVIGSEFTDSGFNYCH